MDRAVFEFLVDMKSYNDFFTLFYKETFSFKIEKTRFSIQDFTCTSRDIYLYMYMKLVREMHLNI